MARKKTKKRDIGVILWWAICAALSIVLACCVLYVVFAGNTMTHDADVPDEIAGIEVHTDYISRDSMARPGQTRTIRFVVIHETDNTGANATAKAHNDYLHQNCWTEQKSWHYTVDQTEIWHHLPDDEIGYHAGDSSEGDGNLHGIGIELCVNEGGDFQQTMQNAAQLTAYLLRRYDLSIDDVKQHRDFSGKICPKTIIQNDGWDDFLQLIQCAVDEQNQQAEQERQAQQATQE